MWTSIKNEETGEIVGWAAEHEGALLVVSRWGAVMAARGLLVLSQTVSSEVTDDDERERLGKEMALDLVRRLR